MEYNTTRNQLIMKEYGRNIQKMVEYLVTIEDEEERQRNAMAVIELMGTLNPHLRNVEDFRHKLWDHIFNISNFKLDVESPYPKPTIEKLRAKPDPLNYPKKYPRNRHFGKNLELIIDKAVHEDSPEKKEGFVQTIANYMKLAYTNWHKESVHDDAIRAELLAISDGQLDFQPGNASAPASANFSGNANASAGGEQFRSGKRKNFQQNKFKGGSNNKSNNNKHNNKYKNRNK
ncbi:protein of unknown function [Chitinophaga terrae (ex Kim and Jung 2007)]|jgi:hypothetical protein|uniref:DUF4290 domain-containing protein n=1 Tax=Chitinophaga terrae (ex Kim and Jung 2007) TaxID=408074 RepID=A0A1H3XT60_9BACT|nr:DUF4290 domain-containing protein [Chitinophaga terrae (ex Kim and Jung 2007)]MDQ0105700.1 hypothetical protein [Chitinophaga terrae (ex Kim and Jung 2007)]GEP89373.1 hypothetical protein CTE07_10180 [Chitinophaga terrae (ex Kim and Jung 2007)]SEA02566.1 protein of unknown function [Chitinophaga terrae (ex Kim and Jung 2007)]